MSTLIYKEAAKLEQDTIVEMFEIDMQRIHMGVFRFCNTSYGGVPVVFNNYAYLPAPIQASGFSWDGAGTMPRPKLSIAAKDLYFLNLVVDADDLVGLPVKRIRTFMKYLDNGSHPDTGVCFPPDEFVIERKTSQTLHSLAFELSTELDQQGTQVPRLMVLRDSCVHTYRYWNGLRFVYDEVSCPYASSSYFKKNGESTAEPSKDSCGKRISDCKLRFGASAVLPRLAFPGVGRI